MDSYNRIRKRIHWNSKPLFCPSNSSWMLLSYLFAVVLHVRTSFRVRLAFIHSRATQAKANAGTDQNWFSNKSRRSLLQERLLSVCNNQLLNYKQNSTVYSGQSNVADIRPTDIPTERKVLTCSHSFTSAKADARMTSLGSRLVYEC